MKRIFTVTLLVALMLAVDVFACTSAIFTGKATPDGRPLLWKHRDTGEPNNRIQYFKGEKYTFYALINSPDFFRNEAWSGTNEVGFSIMNTASYNLKDDDVPSKMMDKEGEVMFKALATCKTLKDFEKMLDKYKRPMGVEANFGVIDAEGGAAYYEVNNDSWTKIDVNDPKIAPQGYLVYTNHSNTGRLNDGMGYVRYTNADKIVKEQINRNGAITPKWIMQNLSRTFYHSVLGIDLNKDKELVDKCNGWFFDQDFIPRKSSTCSIVVAGVKPGEDAKNTVMWTILGYPPVGVAVPLMVCSGDNIPAFMTAKDTGNAQMCDWVLEKKKEIFPITRGNGNKYLNYYAIEKYMKPALEIENRVFEMADPIIEKIWKGEATSDDLAKVYEYVETIF
ncbi:MAG: hypothetical protein IKK19_04605 [Bacteroidales bacterium]|nr:hypothetical protein [Bacteroidales bacterium]MBR1949775.1 hypothetical protein [Bacteroidales bacterium]MBR2438354.1 hypothetical protein [Bacteroidales bacterium]MBR4088567.1 hypothetical protein [Bacteroidales bacterium]